MTKTLEKQLEKMTISRNKVLEMPYTLAEQIVELRDELSLAIETLREYAKSDNPELAKETLIKLKASF